MVIEQDTYQQSKRNGRYLAITLGAILTIVAGHKFYEKLKQTDRKAVRSIAYVNQHEVMPVHDKKSLYKAFKHGFVVIGRYAVAPRLAQIIVSKERFQAYDNLASRVEICDFDGSGIEYTRK